MQYKIQLTNETAVFYEKIACQTGRDAEQVLSDALFKLAGELALEALHKKSKKRSPAALAAGLLWVHSPLTSHSLVTTGMTIGLRFVVLKR